TLALTWLIASFVGIAYAQSPLGSEFKVNGSPGTELDADINVGPDGGFAVGCLDYVDVHKGPEYIATRRFPSSGGELEGLRLLKFSVDLDPVLEQKLIPS